VTPRLCARIASALLVAALLVFGCAGRGLIARHYDPDFYRVDVPLPENTGERNPTFLVYGDNQGCFRLIEDFSKRHNWWTWKQALIPFYQCYWLANGALGLVNGVRTSADGGKRTRLMMRDAVYEAANTHQVDFILNVGDICTHDGRRPAHWRKFLIENKTQSPLLNEVPYLTAPGNHERTSDTTWGMPNYRAVFNKPRCYSRHFRDLSLFVIDSEIICDLYRDTDDDLQEEWYRMWLISGDSTQPGWLERELAACDRPFKIVVMHIPPISFGRHFTDWTGERDYGPRIPEKRRELLNLLHREGVRLVLAGHEHVYQHNVLALTADGGGTDSLHVIVSSGGGVPLRRLPSEREYEQQRQYYQEHDYDVTCVTLQRRFHYTLVSIENEAVAVRTFEINRKAPPRLMEEIRIRAPRTPEPKRG